MEKNSWTATDLSTAMYFGPIEFEDNKGEIHNFELMQTESRIVFGGACNVGFLESGYIEKEEWESSNETLQELLSDLETFYSDGPEFTNRIIFNERM
jgi:hypothetical protein